MSQIQLDFTFEKGARVDEKGNLQIRFEILVDEVDLHFAQGVERRVPGFPSLQSRLVSTAVAYFTDAENAILKPAAHNPAAFQLEPVAYAAASPIETVPAKKTHQPRKKSSNKQNSRVKKRRGRPPLPPKQTIESDKSAGHRSEEKSSGFPKLIKKAELKPI